MVATEQPAEAITKLPGIKGLGNFADAARAKLGLESNSAALRAAIEQLQLLVRQLAGSHSKLVGRIQMTVRSALATPITNDEDPSFPYRRQIFNAAADMLEHRVDLRFSITASRPSLEKAKQWDRFNAMGFIGLSGNRPAIPLTVVSGDMVGSIDKSEPGSISADLRLGSDDSDRLLAGYCTQPLPRVVSRKAGLLNLQVLDAQPAATGGKTDIVLARRSTTLQAPDEATDGVRFFNKIMRVRSPARRMIMDVYFHRTLAAACIPDASVQFYHNGVVGKPSHAWHEHLPHQVRLQLLGAGISNARSGAWNRMQELTHALFDGVGWAGEDFVGYRLDVSYPIWGSAYVLSFDFDVPTKTYA